MTNVYTHKRRTLEEIEKMSPWARREFSRIQFNKEGMGNPNEYGRKDQGKDQTKKPHS